MNFNPSRRKILLTYSIAALFFPLFFCGIYRNDVPKEKYLALGRLPQFDCVGQILDAADKEPIGSCVLIDKQYVLTAAHVVMLSDIREDTIKDNGREIIVYNPINERVGMGGNFLIELKGQVYHCTAVIVHPAYMDSVTKGVCDLALLQLESPVPNILPARLNTDYDELHAEVIGVGYGVSGPAFPADSVFLRGEKIGGMNRIDTIKGYVWNGKETVLGADFDSPINPELSTTGEAKAMPLEYAPGGGDSGGGLFRETEKGWVLIGICSGVGNDIDRLIKYGYYGGGIRWSRVSAFIDWIGQSKK